MPSRILHPFPFLYFQTMTTAHCAMAHPISVSSNLYCAEDADDVASWFEDSADEWSPPFFPVAAETFLSLLAAEEEHMSRPDYISRSPDAAARQDAINWILKVSDFYRFRPATAYLSVNYLDRFLSVRAPPPATEEGQCAGGGWPMQLLSVACISVAAKMEETHVPTLLDLQIFDPKFVFQPRTICRMELILMAALRWRMRAVTPFDFLPHFVSAVLPASVGAELLSSSAELIRGTLRVIDFLIFRPSAIAAAAVFCAASETANSSAIPSLSYFHEWVSKDMVGQCCQLMEEYLMDSCPSARRAMPAAEPQSPVAVLDAAACSSCDARRADSLPPFKRRRLFPRPDSPCTERIDTEDIRL